MKPSLKFTVVLTLILSVPILATAAWAGKSEPGPNGGKLIGSAPDQAEVLIGSDGRLTLTFLDSDHKAAARGTRTAAVFAQLESGKKEVVLAPKGDALVSKEPLPAPEGYTLVLQIRSAPGAKPVNTRITYATHVCGGCKLSEYACTCADH